MIATPPSFRPLVAQQDDENPQTFIFRGAELLVRESDAALPDAAGCEALRIDPAQLHPVGLLDSRYFRTGWVASGIQAPDGFAFTGLRRLWGKVDESLLAVAGRAFQI